LLGACVRGRLYLQATQARFCAHASEPYAS